MGMIDITMDAPPTRRELASMKANAAISSLRGKLFDNDRVLQKLIERDVTPGGFRKSREGSEVFERRAAIVRKFEGRVLQCLDENIWLTDCGSTLKEIDGVKKEARGINGHYRRCFTKGERDRQMWINLQNALGPRKWPGSEIAPIESVFEKTEQEITAKETLRAGIVISALSGVLIAGSVMAGPWGIAAACTLSAAAFVIAPKMIKTRIAGLLGKVKAGMEGKSYYYDLSGVVSHWTMGDNPDQGILAIK